MALNANRLLLSILISSSCLRCSFFHWFYDFVLTSDLFSTLTLVTSSWTVNPTTSSTQRLLSFPVTATCSNSDTCSTKLVFCHAASPCGKFLKDPTPVTLIHHPQLSLLYGASTTPCIHKTSGCHCQQKPDWCCTYRNQQSLSCHTPSHFPVSLLANLWVHDTIFGSHPIKYHPGRQISTHHLPNTHEYLQWRVKFFFSPPDMAVLNEIASSSVSKQSRCEKACWIYKNSKQQKQSKNAYLMKGGQKMREERNKTWCRICFLEWGNQINLSWGQKNIKLELEQMKLRKKSTNDQKILTHY